MAGRCADRVPYRSAFSRPRSQILSYPLPSAVRDAQVWDLLSTAQHYEVADEDQHGFAVLVQRRRPHLDQPLVQTRLRRPHLEHFALDAQRIPRTHGPWPAALLKAGANEAASGCEIALDQEPHGDRGGVPPAGCQSAEYRVARHLLVEMAGLWIEGGGKGRDLLCVDPQPPGAARVRHGTIVEIALSHGSLSPLYTRRARPRPANGAEPGATRDRSGIDQSERRECRAQGEEDMRQVAAPAHRQPAATRRNRQPRQVC